MSFETTGDGAEDENATPCQRLLQRTVQPSVEVEEIKEEKEEEIIEAENIQVLHYYYLLNYSLNWNRIELSEIENLTGLKLGEL